MTIAASHVDGIVLALTPNSRKHPAPPRPTPRSPHQLTQPQTPSTTVPPSSSATPSP